VWENFPYTCLEAMSCGKPVIASGSGGLAEIIEDGYDGILVPPESPEWLADAIVRLLKDVDLRKKIGGHARETVEQKFSTTVIAKRMADLYTDILARSRSWQ